MPHDLTIIFYLYPGQYITIDTGTASGSSTTSNPKLCSPSPSLRKLQLKIYYNLQG
jgi:hypothetical protein